MPIVASTGSSVTNQSASLLTARGRWHVAEIGFFVLLPLCFWIFPDHRLLLAQIAISGIFAMSLDLMQGYGGMPSLGHAAYFGLGAYCAGLMAVAGWNDPLLTLAAAAAIGAVAGVVTGLLLARLHGLAFLMLTLSIGLILREGALRWSSLTGGEDGLYGAYFGPLVGRFELDLYGITAFWYVLVVTVLTLLATRRVLSSPFGVRLEAVRESPTRAEALGVSVFRTRLLVITLAATMAAMAGALLAQTASFVSLETLSLERSVAALVMVALGGLRSVYGAFIGAAIYFVARDQLAALDPVYWFFWLGLVIVFIATFFGDGVVGVLRALAAKRGPK